MDTLGELNRTHMLGDGALSDMEYEHRWRLHCFVGRFAGLYFGDRSILDRLQSFAGYCGGTKYSLGRQGDQRSRSEHRAAFPGSTNA